MHVRWIIFGPLLATALLLCGTGIWLWRRRRRKRARVGRIGRGPPRPRYPVVLAHGVMGFEALSIGGTSHDYFRGVPAHLRALGAQVHTAKVSPSASVATRAEQLAEAVRALDAKKVNIIAHSMGGLDARWAISKLGLASKVASLTTVGTPHRGTPLADLGTRIGDGLRLPKLLEVLGMDVTAFHDLTTTRMAAFNVEVLDARKVSYGCVLARAAGGISGINALLWPAHRLLKEKAGDNDGLVPLDSQRWGEVFEEIEADHWAQIGWSGKFDAKDLYARLLTELRGRGL